MNPVDPAIVSQVDQGAALTTDVLHGWVADYRAMIADGVDSTTALLSITLSVNDAANEGAKGQDGLVSLVAVAVAELALHTPASGSWLQDVTNLADGQAYTLPCGCGYNAAGVQCAVGMECGGKHVEPCRECLAGVCTVHDGGLRYAAVPRSCPTCHRFSDECATCDDDWHKTTHTVEAVVGDDPNPKHPYADLIAEWEGQGYVFPARIKRLVDELPPPATKQVTKADCTCPDPDSGEFAIGCPAHIVIPMGPMTEPVEPWHGKAVETTFTTNTARCSYCYRLGGDHAPTCTRFGR